MGALAGVLGSMMALEAIREIVGFGEGLVGRFVDGGTPRDAVRNFALPAEIVNPLGDALVITDLSGHRSTKRLTACLEARGPAACDCRGRF